MERDPRPSGNYAAGIPACLACAGAHHPSSLSSSAATNANTAQSGSSQKKKKEKKVSTVSKLIPIVHAPRECYSDEPLFPTTPPTLSMTADKLCLAKHTIDFVSWYQDLESHLLLGLQHAFPPPELLKSRAAPRRSRSTNRVLARRQARSLSFTFPHSLSIT